MEKYLGEVFHAAERDELVALAYPLEWMPHASSLPVQIAAGNFFTQSS